MTIHPIAVGTRRITLEGTLGEPMPGPVKVAVG